MTGHAAEATELWAKLPKVMRPSTAEGFPLVKGRCPGCGFAHLFLAVGGYVTCGYLKCPNPGAASDLLEAWTR